MNSYVNQRLSQRKLTLTHQSRKSSFKNQQKKSGLSNFQPNQQRKSSLSNYQRNKTTKIFIQNQTSSTNVLQNLTNIMTNQQQKQACASSSKKSITSKSRLRDEQSSDYIRNLYKKYLGKQNKQGDQYQPNSSAQYQNKSTIQHNVSNQQNISNQQNNNKSNLDMLTQRKLRTTQSKQLFYGNGNNIYTELKDFNKNDNFKKDINKNQNFKGFQKRALFKNQEIDCNNNQSNRSKLTNLGNENSNLPINTNKKSIKTKISTILKNQNQTQGSDFFGTSNDNNKENKRQKQTSKLSYQSKSKQYESKRQKKNNQIIQLSNKELKRGRQKNQLNNDSKRAIQKNELKKQLKIQKTNLKQKSLIRSNSAHLKRQSSQIKIHHQNYKPKQKIFTQVNQISSKISSRLSSKHKIQVNDKSNVCKEKENKIHPHRESYCQFDTEKQLSGHDQGYKSKKQTLKQHQKHNEDKFADNEGKYGNKDEKSLNDIRSRQKLTKKGNLYQTFKNDIDTLKMLVGQENSIYKALKRINRIKNNKSNKKTDTYLKQYQVQSNFYD